ncbi:MAG: DUF2796 domain-containing protein [Hyphomicrobiaceae bacterium]
MKTLAVLVIAARVAAVLLPTASIAQEARREVGAHVHGEGKLAVAIEKGKVSMELEAPAKDIIGFEHAPKTAKEKKTLADAKARLAQGVKVFTLSPEAQCKKSAAKVELIGLAAKATKAHNHDKHAHGNADAGSTAEHAEFRVTYAFECKVPAALKTIGLGYFEAFKGAERLDVSLIGPKGQTSFEVGREKPSIDLGAVN